MGIDRIGQSEVPPTSPNSIRRSIERKQKLNEEWAKTAEEVKNMSEKARQSLATQLPPDCKDAEGNDAISASRFKAYCKEHFPDVFEEDKVTEKYFKPDDAYNCIEILKIRQNSYDELYRVTTNDEIKNKGPKFGLD